MTGWTVVWGTELGVVADSLLKTGGISRAMLSMGRPMSTTWAWKRALELAGLAAMRIAAAMVVDELRPETARLAAMESMAGVGVTAAKLACPEQVGGELGWPVRVGEQMLGT